MSSSQLFVNKIILTSEGSHYLSLTCSQGPEPCPQSPPQPNRGLQRNYALFSSSSQWSYWKKKLNSVKLLIELNSYLWLQIHLKTNRKRRGKSFQLLLLYLRHVFLMWNYTCHAIQIRTAFHIKGSGVWGMGHKTKTKLF